MEHWIRNGEEAPKGREWVLRVLKVLKFDGPMARGLWIAAFRGYAYEISVTGIPFLYHIA